MGITTSWSHNLKKLAIAAPLLLLAVPMSSASLAQTDEQKKWCYDPNATDPQTIDGCTALANSGQFSGRDLAIVLYNRGLSYENTKQYDLALSDFSQAVGLDPTYYDAFDDRGNVYSHLGKYDLAIAEYDHALQIKPDYALALSNRGYNYYLKGDLDRALDDLNRSVALGSTPGRTFVDRALVFVAKHDCTNAAQDYLRARQANWKFSIPNNAKAQCGAAFTSVLGP